MFLKYLYWVNLKVPISVTSTAVSVQFSQASDIEKRPFAYTSDIPYENHQAAIVVFDGNSIYLERFRLRDGGALANDADGTGTTLTSLTLSITNGANLRSIALFDASDGKIAMSEQPGGTSVTFSGIAITAADDGFFDFLVRASFTAPVIDNQAISFQVTAATAAISGSGFAAPDAGGAMSSLTGQQNQIEVTATQLDFTNQPAATSINTVFGTPPQVSARDVLMSVDRDYTDPVGTLDVDDGGASLTFDADITGGTATDPLPGFYVLGVYDFPANFAMTEAGDGMDIVMTLPDDGGVAPTDAVSNMFDIIASMESQVVLDGSFSIPTRVVALAHRDNNIMDGSPDPGSTILGRFILLDGDGIMDDQDGAGTLMTDIELAVKNGAAFVSRIALYDTLGNEIDEIAADDTVTFTGLSMTAPDDDSLVFDVRVTFLDSLVDLDSLALAVVSVTEGTGSDFAPILSPTAGAIGFTNDYAPGNWTTTIDNTDGSVNLAGVPNSITLFGGNDGLPGGEQLVNGGLNTTLIPWVNAGPVPWTISSNVLYFTTVTPFEGPTFATSLVTASSAVMYQDITIPAGASNVQLNWNRWVQVGSGIGTWTVTIRNLANGILAFAEGPLNFGAGYNDLFWVPGNFNLSGFAGQTVRIYFEAADLTGTTGFSLDNVSVTYDPQLTPGNTDYVRINVPVDGTISFDWSYGSADGRGQAFDPAGYLLNAGFNNLSVGGAAGMQAVPVTAGDDFGFRVNTSDGHSGQASLNITNFVFSIGTGFPAPQTPDDKNLIDVIATQLDFTTQPDSLTPVDNALIGVGVPFVDPPVLQARDSLTNLDLEFNNGALITTVNNNRFSNAPAAFGMGVLNFGLFQYDSTGRGDITVDAGGLNNTSIRVDVINTLLSQEIGGIPGVIDFDTTFQASISDNQAILGIGLVASTSGVDLVPPEPRIDSLTFDFSVDINGTYENIRLFRSDDNAFNKDDDSEIAVVPDPSAATFSVTFNLTPPGPNDDLDENTFGQFYFLVIDATSTVFDGTTPVFSSIDPTGIHMSSGSVSGPIVVGETYYFDDKIPPTVVTLLPGVDSENNDPATELFITFDEPTLLNEDLYPFDSAGFQLFRRDQLADVLVEDIDSVTTMDSLTYVLWVDGGADMKLGDDSTYFVLLAPGDTVTGTGFADRQANQFAGFTTNTDWFFKTSDSQPPVFRDTTIVNIFDFGFELRAQLNEPGKVFYLLTVAAAPMPTTAQVRDPVGAGYPGLGFFSDSVDIPLGFRNYFSPVFSDTLANMNLTLWVTAEDLAQPNPNEMLAVGGLDFSTPAGSGPGVLIFSDTLEICFGEFQDIKELVIMETANGEFGDPGVAGQTLTLGLPNGFVFNLDSGSAVSELIGSGSADVSNLVMNYINSTTLRLTYDVDGTPSGRDLLRVVGLEVNSESTDSTSGDFLRVGGTAVQTGNEEVDNRSHGFITALGTLDLDYITSPSNAGPIPDNVDSVILIPPFGLGDATFSGNAVVNEVFFPLLAGLGDTEVTLTVVDDFGCISTHTETITVIENASAISGLETSYCVDEPFDVIPVFPLNRPGERLLTLTFFEEGDTTQTEPDGLTLVPLVEFRFDPGAVPDSIVKVPIKVPDNVLFVGEYKQPNGDTLIFTQLVTLYEPPVINPLVAAPSTRPVFNAPHYCRDDGVVVITPTIDFFDSDGTNDVYTYTITDNNTATAFDAVVDLGLTINADGSLNLDTQVLADSLVLNNTKDSINLTVELVYTDAFACDDTLAIGLILNEIPNLTFQVDDVGPVGTIIDPQYCFDAPVVLLRGLDDSVAVSSGIFSGDGVFDNGNGSAQFTPRLAAEITETQSAPNFPHPVLIIYSDSTTGCTNSFSDTLVVQPLPVVNVATGIAGMGNLLDTYCQDAPSLLIQGTATSAAGRDTSVFYLNGILAGMGANGLTDNQDETANFDAATALLASGDTTTRTPYQIVLTFTDLNQCVQSDTVNIEVQPLPLATFTIKVDAVLSNVRQFCVNDIELIELGGTEPLGSTGNLTPLGEFFGTAGSGKAVDDGGTAVTTADYFPTAFRDSMLTSQLIDVVLYEFTDDFGCFNSTSQAITLDPLPLPSFVIDSVCSKEVVGFLATPDVASTDSPDLYIWNFGELGANDTTFTVPQAFNEFEEPNVYDVSLKIQTVNGCLSDSVFRVPILVGTIPEPQITWRNVCETNATLFNGVPKPFDLPQAHEIVEQYIWDFGDGSTFTGTDGFASHTYANSGDYLISLRLITNTTCDTMVMREVSILPTITPVASDEYFADFETTGGGWRVEIADTTRIDSVLVRNPTWALGIVNHSTHGGPGNGADTDQNNIAWVTNPTGDYESEENSWVYSPCFNITQLEQPMMSLRTWIDTDPADGAIVQYSISGGLDWQVLRIQGDSETHESAINWFNTDGINAVPGEINNDARYGWSMINSEWRTSKHRLDEIMDSGKSEVRFRMAFASVFRDFALDKIGFAFDDVFVGERDRLVLLEQFTNSTIADNKTANDGIGILLNDFDQDLISVEYHTDFPQPDPFNEANPLDPSGRRAYYNVPTTPYSFIDGGFNPLESAKGGESLDGLNLTFFPSDIRRRSLTDPMFVINVSLPSAGTDEIEVNVSISALTDINVRTRTQIAIIERVVTGVNAENGETEFRNVLRKMLPDAGGLNNIGPTNPDQFSAGESYQVPGQNWTIRNVLDPDQLAVVVFVQSDQQGDPDTNGRFFAQREVFQAALLSVTGKQIVTATSEEELLEFLLSDILLYPNPADHQMSILFNTKAKEEIIWKVIDMKGVEMAEGKVGRGISEFSIDTQNYASGLYNLFLGNSNIDFQSKTFVIRH